MSAFIVGCALFLVSCGSEVGAGGNGGVAKDGWQAAGGSQQTQGVLGKNMVVKSMYNGDDEMWRLIFKKGELNPVKFDSSPLGIILPHHMVDQYEISKFYAGLRKAKSPKVVFVLSPNHYQAGTADIQTCSSCLFKTTLDGDLSVDSGFVDKLVKDVGAEFDDQAFIKEHGIYNHASFIKHYFPDAKILPILLKWESSKDELLKLKNWISVNLPDDGLLLASVDFSHYIPIEAADFHDVTTFSTISNFDFDHVHDAEIDSPASIFTMLSVMKDRGYIFADRFFHTNSQTVHRNRIMETTSHQHIAFFKGEKPSIKKSVTIMSFGDVYGGDALPKNIGLGFYDNYQWRLGASDVNLDVNPLLRDVRGKEDRFLVGANFLIFDLDVNECEQKEVNSVKISFCKFSGAEGNFSDDLKIVSEEKKKGSDYVYLQYNFGAESLIERKILAKKFIDSGVSVFVGKSEGGVFIPPTVERYKYGLIAYSLGDFVNEGTKDSFGVALAIDLEQGKINYQLFDLSITGGYPRLVVTDKWNRFKNF